MALATFESIIKTLQNTSENGCCGFRITSFDDACLNLLTDDRLPSLCRVEPDEQNREYLDRVVRDVKKRMERSGAVRASLRNLEDGLYPPP